MGSGNIRYHPGRRRLKDERVQMSESDYDLSSKQWFQSINRQNQLLFLWIAESISFILGMAESIACEL
jgi:hypothetical protein